MGQLANWSTGSRARGSALMLVVSLSVGTAHAQEKFAAPDTAERVATSPTAGMASMLVSLLIVLAAVFAAAWVMRRLRGGALGGKGVIEVLADMPLSTKERAVLVRVGRQQMLLGVAPGRVNTLHVFAEGQEPVNPDAPAMPTMPAMPAHVDFKTILRRSVGLK